MPNTVKARFVREFLVWQRLTFRCVAWILNLRNISQVSDEILVQTYSTTLLFPGSLLRVKFQLFPMESCYHSSGFAEASVLTLCGPPSAPLENERNFQLYQKMSAPCLWQAVCVHQDIHRVAAVIVSLLLISANCEFFQLPVPGINTLDDSKGKTCRTGNNSLGTTLLQ